MPPRRRRGHLELFQFASHLAARTVIKPTLIAQTRVRYVIIFAEWRRIVSIVTRGPMIFTTGGLRIGPGFG